MAKVAGKIFDLKLFGKLMRFVRPYRRTYYFVMIAAVLLSSFSVTTPILIKVMVDDYITPKDFDGMLFFILLMVGVLIMEVLFQFLFVFYANWLGTKRD